MIYLDNASTTFPKPKIVAEAISNYLNNYSVSYGRSLNTYSNRVQDKVDRLRFQILSLLNLKQGNIFFTQNATHSANVVLKGSLAPNSHVIICNFSHNAIQRPIHSMASSHNITYSVLNVDQDRKSVIDDLGRLIQDNTRMICLNHVSNVLGAEIEIDPILDFAKRSEIPTLLDATQSLGVRDLDFDKVAPNYIIGTGHKSLMGPTGIGFIYSQKPDFDSLIQGGTGYNSVSASHPEKLPDKYEAGTQNITGIVGLLAGIESLEASDGDQAMMLSSDLESKLTEISEVNLLKPNYLQRTVPLVSFNIKNAASLEIAELLDSEFGISVRGGIHCAPLIHRHLGTFPNGSVRVSFGKFSTSEDLNRLIYGIKKIISDQSFTKIVY